MIRGCLKLMFALVVVAVLGVVAWINRDQLEMLWRKTHVTAPEPARVVTPEKADEADRKLARLRSGEAREIGLTQEEVESLIRYRYAELLPAFVDSPRVEFRNSRIRLRARVPVDKLPRVGGLGEAVDLLPDTTELAVMGQLLPLDAGRVALAVDEVSAAGIPLPKRLVPGTLNRLGRTDEPGLRPDALALPLPPGVSAAYVRGDSLHFLTTPAARPVR